MAGTYKFLGVRLVPEAEVARLDLEVSFPNSCRSNFLD